MNARLAVFFILWSFAVSTSAQSPDRESWKTQYKTDWNTSGVGLVFAKPQLGPFHVQERNWVGADALFGFIHAQFGQGTYLIDPRVTGFQNPDPDPSNWDEIRFSRASIGINAPLPFLAIGRYERYDRVFRMHGIVKANWQVHRYFGRTDQPTRYGAFELAPGVRLRLPYASIDFALNVNFINEAIERSRNAAQNGLSARHAYPSITVRFDGLFDRMTIGTSTTTGATFSSTRKEERRRYTNSSGARMEERKVTYNTTASPTSVTLTDIGVYYGFGLKITRSAIRNLRYAEPGLLVGAQAMLRKGPGVFAFNLEGGRVGHGSELRPWKDGYHRQLKTDESYGQGSLRTVNAFIDAGISLNNLIYTAFGTAVVDDVATPFSSINMGVSFGLNFAGGQAFTNPEEATTRYDALTEEASWFNDPRQSKGGTMGGYFFSWDIGNASFKAQWYRFRRAPLANGLMYSVIWRFGQSD